MNKKAIGNIGSGFTHSTSSTLYKIPNHIEWKFGQILETTFFCDNAVIDGISANCENKYAWLVESRDIIPAATKFVKENVKLVSNAYKYLFTHNEEIYSLADNFVFLPSHGSWVEDAPIQKTKLVSMISSNKGWTEGHRKRLEWVQKLRGSVDLYGRGFNEFKRHEDALAAYYYSVCAENDMYKTYFSEKVLSCFSAKTIPIYYGAPDIGKFFNPRGIITLDENFQIKNLTEEDYWSRIDAINENFELVKEYNIIEDIVWEKYLKGR